VEEWLRTLLLVGVGIVIFGFLVSIFFCAGLSDIVKWTSCDTVLAVAGRGEQAVRHLLAQAWSALAGR